MTVSIESVIYKTIIPLKDSLDAVAMNQLTKTCKKLYEYKNQFTCPKSVYDEINMFIINELKKKPNGGTINIIDFRAIHKNNIIPTNIPVIGNGLIYVNFVYRSNNKNEGGIWPKECEEIDKRREKKNPTEKDKLYTRIFYTNREHWINTKYPSYKCTYPSSNKKRYMKA